MPSVDSRGKMFLPPPEFVFDTCLKLNLDRHCRLKLAELADRGEPCVRKWYRDNSFPSKIIDKAIVYLGKVGNGTINDEVKMFLEGFILPDSAAYKWRVFCAGFLANKDVFLPHTVREIHSYSEKFLNAVSLARGLKADHRFDCFKRFLFTFVGPKFDLPNNLQQQVENSNNWEDLRPAMTWLSVETFIYFLAMAEVEYLWVYYRKSESKVTTLILPELDREKVRYPIMQFFRYFFDELVRKYDYQSLDDVANKMPRILPLSNRGKESRKNRSDVDEDSRMRHIKRAKYEGKVPSFETFNAWIDALIPSQIYHSTEDRELEKQLLLDSLGAARIVDGFFKEVSKEIPEKELVSRFESYKSWHRFHCAAIII